jgi:Leucine-rich repeat (LRR) protein
MRFRFGLRALLIVTTAICVMFGVLLREAIDYRNRKTQARTLIDSLQGTIKSIGWSLEPSDGDNWLSRLMIRTEYHEQLWSVDLSKTKVSGDDLEALSRCDWIRELKLANTSTGDDDLSHIAKLDKLRTLDIRNTNVTDAGLPKLESLQRLVALQTLGSQITYAGVLRLDRLLPESNFEQSRAIEHLPLPGVAVHGHFGTYVTKRRHDDEFGCHFLAPGTKVTIMVTNGDALTDGTFEHLKHMRHARDFSGSFGKERFENVDALTCWPELRRVSIDGGELTDADFLRIARLPNLKYLSLAGWHRISDEAPKHFGENHRLEHLDISGLDTSLGITSHLTGLKRLRLLELSIWEKNENGKYEPWTGKRAEQARAAIRRLHDLPSLEAVRLHGNVFADEAMLELADFKQLKQIGYDEQFVSQETVTSLKASLPGCEIKSQGFTDHINLD